MVARRSRPAVAAAVPVLVAGNRLFVLSRGCALLAALAGGGWAHPAPAERPRLGLLGPADGNALVAACRELDVIVETAAPGPATCTGLLVCAASYPSVEPLTEAQQGLVGAFLAAGRAVYVEFTPVPGLMEGPARGMQWERLAVPAQEAAGAGLAPLTLVDEHACPALSLAPAAVREGARARLVYARVAGVERAVFGLPAQTTPALVEVRSGGGRLVLCAAALSRARQARWKPAAAARQLARSVVLAVLPEATGAALAQEPAEAEAWTEPREWVAPGAPVTLWVSAKPGTRVQATGPGGEVALTEREAGRWASDPVTPGAGGAEFRVTVERAGAARERTCRVEVAPRAERHRDAVARNLRWFQAAGMLPAADGSRGVLEGLTSALTPEGRPAVATCPRVDCISECALLFTLWGKLAGDAGWAAVGRSMSAYTGRAFQVTVPDTWYFGHWQSRGEFRDDGSTVYVFSDDSGAATLFSLLGYAASGDASLLQAGLRGAEFFVHTASSETGLWCGMVHRGYEGSGEWGTPWPDQRAQSVPSAAPHVVNLPLAGLLVAYRLTGERRYLQVAERGVRTLMDAWPNWPIVTSRTCEHTRMLLPLALLQAVAPSPEHREWLDRVAGYLLEHQDPCGALQELDGCNPGSNEAFGTGENSVFQQNSDPISDQLYDTGFAALHLWLAYQATGDPRLEAAFRRLADYACRIQLRDDDPLYDGTWLRAFDYRRWEYFGSPADIGWGPYCAETGWQCAPLDLGLLLSLQGREAPLLGVLPEGPNPHLRARADEARVEFDRAEALLLAPPPAMEGEVTVTVQPGNRVRLTWDGRRGQAARFSVYRAQGAICTLDLANRLGTTGSASWDDWSAEPGQTYTYRVAATNGLGQDGVPSEPVAVQTGGASLARGCAYAKSEEPDPAYPDTGGAESTDGVYAGAYGDGKSYGYRLAEVGDHLALTVTADLGAVKAVACASHQNCGAPDYRPDSVAVEVSEDGAQWTRAAETREATGGRMWVEFPQAQARWVRFVLDKTRTGATDDWLFVGEVEVY
jgi:hypothetical protein